MFHLQSASCCSGFQIRMRPDEQADDEERSRREHHQAVRRVPAAIADQRQELVAEERPGAEKLAKESRHHQNDA